MRILLFRCLLSRKDTTLKAIHNKDTLTLGKSELFAISQRYYIESNSQQISLVTMEMIAVCYLAKILHWKQFTTPRADWITLKRLFAISQRYYIESNSQRCAELDVLPVRCLLSRKDTTLKAIHNPINRPPKTSAAVCYLAKILHWKQFTTAMNLSWQRKTLFAISQRYYIESNSQLSITWSW